jgi:hypothetical protein
VYWQKNRHENQWNRIEDTHTNPHSYSHLIFLGKKPAASVGEKTATSNNGAWKTNIHL